MSEALEGEVLPAELEDGTPRQFTEFGAVTDVKPGMVLMHRGELAMNKRVQLLFVRSQYPNDQWRVMASDGSDTLATTQQLRDGFIVVGLDGLTDKSLVRSAARLVARDDRGPEAEDGEA